MSLPLPTIFGHIVCVDVTDRRIADRLAADEALRAVWHDPKLNFSTGTVHLPHDGGDRGHARVASNGLVIVFAAAIEHNQRRQTSHEIGIAQMISAERNG
jgi:hypothetical protein